MVYDRLENENEAQYLYRIGQAKERGIIMDTWEEIANIINDTFKKEPQNRVGEAAYRKRYYHYKEAIEFDVVKAMSSQESALKKVVEEIKDERIKLQTLNIERNRYDREASRQSLYYEYLKDAIISLPLPEYEPLYLENAVEDINTNYVVCIADMHYGAQFKSMNNEYSPQICADRLHLLSTYILDFVREKRLNTITILELGDTIQGILRVSDLKLNDSSIVKAVVDVSRLLAQFLNELSKYVRIEYYHVGTSNHSQIRPLGTRANQLADEDMEYVIGNYISDLLQSNTRINVHLVENGANFIDIEGLHSSVVAAHGHQFVNLDNAVRDLSMLRQEFIDYLIVGHYHNAKNVDVAEGCTYNMELLCCPSFIGSDPYADSLLKGSKAAAVIYGFNEVYGHTETYKYILN